MQPFPFPHCPPGAFDAKGLGPLLVSIGRTPDGDAAYDDGTMEGIGNTAGAAGKQAAFSSGATLLMVALFGYIGYQAFAGGR
jgi:hypothetical protein